MTLNGTEELLTDFSYEQWTGFCIVFQQGDSNQSLAHAWKDLYH